MIYFLAPLRFSYIDSPFKLLVAKFALPNLEASTNDRAEGADLAALYIRAGENCAAGAEATIAETRHSWGRLF